MFPLYPSTCLYLDALSLQDKMILYRTLKHFNHSRFHVGTVMQAIIPIFKRLRQKDPDSSQPDLYRKTISRCIHAYRFLPPHQTLEPEAQWKEYGIMECRSGVKFSLSLFSCLTARRLAQFELLYLNWKMQLLLITHGC